MKRLYPDIGCYASGYLQTQDDIALYYELSGNPEGIPVLYIHGGPGAGLSPDYRRFFDGNRYRIIAFEQRGCGRSKPFGSTTNNTTQDTLSDITALRRHLGIERWILFGGSWGATLALLSAIEAPQTVLGLILRGVFLARQEDRDWFLGPDGGGAQLFPEYYEQFVAGIAAPVTPARICQWYQQQFDLPNEAQRLSALKRWYVWEERLSRLSLPPGTGDFTTHYPLPLVTCLAKLECHYLLNDCFLAENYILDNIHKISHLPGTIVHGRYDVICKARAAWQLHKAWQASNLFIVADAGHTTSEIGVALKLCRATRDMSRYVGETS
ncbi:prolyl aminopeptidase [Salinimonas sediminis]|uniref:Proline iminopeptidase n=1 Tax=Salinimonas sediminis TaxID=2303538 RepID=A0A346NQY8_9ALTE|nr:prolyl aminopeptidase [Salinimonas sediminis]AXR07945.1 prolyl aminopeptidase [Salinimonas sediminis]